MNDRDNSLEKLFEVASERMMSAFTAYHMWKWLSQAININHPKGRAFADRNVEVIKPYPYFFTQTGISHYKSFVVDLSIFFDKSARQEAFSPAKLIDLLASKIPADELLTLEKEIAEIKRRHGVTIGLIKELRNKDVAHQTMNPKSRHVLYAQIEDLFAGVQEILNLLSLHHDRSTTIWDHIPREVEGEMTWILDNLERGERGRLEEIDKE